jgi:hypothetical protein
VGEWIYFFHLEDFFSDFCSEECLQKQYSCDQEAQDLTRQGYVPDGFGELVYFVEVTNGNVSSN